MDSAFFRVLTFLFIILCCAAFVIYGDYYPNFHGEDLSNLPALKRTNKKTSKSRTFLDEFDHYGTYQRPLYHSKNTKFLHHGIELYHPSQAIQNGLVTKCNIRAGEILLVEYPLLRVDDVTLVPMDKRIGEAVQRNMKSDAEFKRIWSTLYHKPNTLSNLIQLERGSFGKRTVGVYALLSKIKFFSPHNVAVIFRPKDEGYVCVVIATTDIRKGSRLVASHLTGRAGEKPLNTDLGIESSKMAAKIKQSIDSGGLFKILNQRFQLRSETD